MCNKCVPNWPNNVDKIGRFYNSGDDVFYVGDDMYTVRKGGGVFQQGHCSMCQSSYKYIYIYQMGSKSMGEGSGEQGYSCISCLYEKIERIGKKDIRKEPMVGKLTECSEATKELRKQFKKEKPVKLTKKGEQAKKILEGGDWGCSTNSAYELVSFLVGEEIPTPKSARDSSFFEPVVGALVKCLDSDAAMDVGTLSQISRTRDTNEMQIEGRTDYQSTLKELWKPATDAEIKKYFS